jgi:hypothetical protein
MLANHPILYPMSQLQVFIIAPLGILVLALIRGYFPANGDRESLLSFVEASERKLWGGRKLAA